VIISFLKKTDMIVVRLNYLVGRYGVKSIHLVGFGGIWPVNKGF